MKLNVHEMDDLLTTNTTTLSSASSMTSFDGTTSTSSPRHRHRRRPYSAYLSPSILCDMSFYQCLRTDESFLKLRKNVENREANESIKWINTTLDGLAARRNLHVASLHDLGDGLKLVYFLEVLYKVTLSKEQLNHNNSCLRLHKIKNFETCITFMKVERGCLCVGIHPYDLVDCTNVKIMLGFLFLIKHDYECELAARERQRLLEAANRLLPKPPVIDQRIGKDNDVDDDDDDVFLKPDIKPLPLNRSFITVSSSSSTSSSSIDSSMTSSTSSSRLSSLFAKLNEINEQDDGQQQSLKKVNSSDFIAGNVYKNELYYVKFSSSSSVVSLVSNASVKEEEKEEERKRNGSFIRYDAYLNEQPMFASEMAPEICFRATQTSPVMEADLHVCEVLTVPPQIVDNQIETIQVAEEHLEDEEEEENQVVADPVNDDECDILLEIVTSTTNEENQSQEPSLDETTTTKMPNDDDDSISNFAELLLEQQQLEQIDEAADQEEMKFENATTTTTSEMATSDEDLASINSEMTTNNKSLNEESNVNLEYGTTVTVEESEELFSYANPLAAFIHSVEAVVASTVVDDESPHLLEATQDSSVVINEAMHSNMNEQAANVIDSGHNIKPEFEKEEITRQTESEKCEQLPAKNDDHHYLESKDSNEKVNNNAVATAQLCDNNNNQLNAVRVENQPPVWPIKKQNKSPATVDSTPINSNENAQNKADNKVAKEKQTRRKAQVTTEAKKAEIVTRDEKKDEEKVEKSPKSEEAAATTSSATEIKTHTGQVNSSSTKISKKNKQLVNASSPPKDVSTLQNGLKDSKSSIEEKQETAQKSTVQKFDETSTTTTKQLEVVKKSEKINAKQVKNQNLENKATVSKPSSPQASQTKKQKKLNHHENTSETNGKIKLQEEEEPILKVKNGNSSSSSSAAAATANHVNDNSGRSNKATTVASIVVKKSEKDKKAQVKWAASMPVSLAFILAIVMVILIAIFSIQQTPISST